MSKLFIVFLVLVVSSLNCDVNEKRHMEVIKDIVVTDSPHAQTPDLWIDQRTIHLTWAEENADTTTLFYTRIEGDKFSTSQVASGTDWFVNWADFSRIASDRAQPSNLITHWLQKSATGTYDYDIKISKSVNGGQNWLEPNTLHNDHIAAEHGFVSLIDYNSSSFFATWLDGRNTKTPDPSNPENKLPMSLRAGVINKGIDNTITEYPIDQKVCDCCQTSCVKTSLGALIAYRDRSDEEIRDIIVQRFNSDGSEVVFRSNDNWKINGCPVNGPALASTEEWSALSWYTAADSPSVFMAYGKNASFDQKIKIDNGNPLGRVDIEISKNKAYVTWLEMNDQRAEIRIKTIDLISNSIIDDQLITYTSPERRSGFPILKLSDQYAYITYTEVLSADNTTVKLKQIKI